MIRFRYNESHLIRVVKMKLRKVTVITIVEWTATVTAIVGVMLNNQLDRRCFFAWLISNAISGWMHWRKAMWSLLVRDAVFFVLAIYGIYAWSQRGV